jgi:MerR family transcriptional regulator, light-induced transcriptional regulator
VQVIRTNAAATMLGVSANTLRSWERRYGFPRPQRSAGGHRNYELFEIEALRQTLAETHNVSSAVSLAEERGTGPSSSARLAEAFAAFDEQLADLLLEESLALRSVERTIEEVLLPAVADQAEHDGPTAAFEFAWRHATGWLSALKRLAPLATRRDGALIIDAWVACEIDTLQGQALEVVLRRAGLRTLSFTPAIDRSRLGRALCALDPRVLVLTGRSVLLDEIARLVYAVRSVCPEILVFDYRGPVPESGPTTVHRLARSPIAARDELLRRLDVRAGSAAFAASRGARSGAPVSLAPAARL